MKKAAIIAVVAIAGTVAFWRLRPEEAAAPELPIAQVAQQVLEQPEALAPTSDQEDAGSLLDAELENSEMSAVVTDGTAGSIAGRVFWAETEKPIAELRMLLHTDGGAYESSLSTVTDKNGHYDFQDLSAGRYKVRYSAMEVPRTNEEQLPLVTLSESQSVDNVNIPITMGLRVAGKVVDAEGNLVAGVQVEGRDRNDYRSLESYWTGEDGTFELLGFRKTDKFTLETDKDGDLASAQYGPVRLGPAGLSDVVLTLNPTATISGKIVTPEGWPLPDVRVNPSLNAEHQRYAGRKSAYAAEDGSFTLGGLIAGSYKMLLLPDGTNTYMIPEPPWHEFSVTHGQHLDEMNLVLDVDLGASIFGRVLDKRGAPIEQVEIRCRGGLSLTWARSQRDGSYRLLGLDDRLYELVFTHDEFAKARYEDVPTGTEELTVTLDPRGAIEGRVLDGLTGTPISEYEILHVDDHNKHFVGVRDRFSRRRDEEGRFRIDAVEPGPVTLVAKAPGYGETSVEIPHVESGQVVRGIEIRLRGQATVAGIVLDVYGEPVAAVGIIPGEIPRVKHPSTAVVAASDAEGAFRLEGLCAGPQTISAYHDDYAVASVSVELAAGREEAVTITLPKGGIVEGTVYHDGSPWPGQSVQLSAGRAGGSGSPPVAGLLTDTSEDGTYRFENVRPGDGSLLVRAWLLPDEATRQRRWLSQGTVAADGETTVVDFHFAPASASLEGQVSFDAEPLHNVSITLFVENPTGTEQYNTRVNDNGQYQFERVPAGPAWLHVNSLTMELSGEVAVGISEGEAIHLDVDLAHADPHPTQGEGE